MRQTDGPYRQLVHLDTGAMADAVGRAEGPVEGQIFQLQPDPSCILRIEHNVGGAGVDQKADLDSIHAAVDMVVAAFAFRNGHFALSGLDRIAWSQGPAQPQRQIPQLSLEGKTND